MIKCAREITFVPETDGDLDAKVFKLSGPTNPGNAFEHRIYHQLGRVPVGAQVIMSNIFAVLLTKEATKDYIIVRVLNAIATQVPWYVNVRVW